MTDQNPFAFQGNESTAADAAIADKAIFLKKTYTWLLMGILGFCATVWAVGKVPAVNQFAMQLVHLHPFVTIALLLGASFGVHALAERRPINVVAYAAYVVFFGMLVGPWIAFADPTVVSQAALITGLIFAGLTTYVFVKGHDFSFMGGVLNLVLWGMIAAVVGGLLFNFQLGLWFSVLGAMLFSGYILYDTSRILHHYPTTAHVTAAIVLFVDVIMLFKHLLALLSSRD